MMVGAVVGWGILGPIAKVVGWAPGAVSDWEGGGAGWIMWISLAIMLGESMTSLILLIVTSVWKRYQTHLEFKRYVCAFRFLELSNSLSN
jgi:uncharacterized oligopeptide transporter (OPT) family protein